MIRILYLFFFLVLPVHGQLTFRYIDPSGFGFNDQTPVNPVGGNTGTTLGQQRRIVLERSGEIWSSFLEFNGPVEVRAEFNNVACTASGAVLASAGPLSSQRNFPNAPFRNVTYPAALVNHLAGTDRFPSQSEIQVLVNEEVDSDPSCLGGSGYYYGLDGLSGFRIDLLATLTHELGHGLGFISFVNESTGRQVGGVTDTYSRNLRDLAIEKDWPDMSDAERAASAINDPFVVWTGANTNAAADGLLSGLGQEQISFSISGGRPQIFAAAGSVFGPALSSQEIIGEVALVDDGTVPITDACEDIPFGKRAALAGKIVLVDRRECFFIEKVNRAEAAGAIAVLIANNVPDELFTPGFDPNGTIPQPTIPSFMITFDAGQLLRSFLGTTVTISRAGNAGTAQGHLRVFAPSPLDLGSSVSHWSPTASPNLLMEPFLSALPNQHPDLTLTAMREMGWTVKNIPFPNLTYELWSDMFLSDVSSGLREPEDDPDNDGISNLDEYALGTDPDDSESFKKLLLQINADNQQLIFDQSNQPTDLLVEIFASETLLENSFIRADDLNELPGELSDEDIERRFFFEVDLARRFFALRWELK